MKIDLSIVGAALCGRLIEEPLPTAGRHGGAPLHLLIWDPFIF
jgi:hypothetical protein